LAVVGPEREALLILGAVVEAEVQLQDCCLLPLGLLTPLLLAVGEQRMLVLLMELLELLAFLGQ
jgi:hypothetical protein